MSFFEFPHTRTYDSDLGFIIAKMKELLQEYGDITDWMTIHKDEYEILADKVDGLINNLVDVIVPWDSSREYGVFSIVEYLGQNYIAIQDVPVGAMITDTTYWVPANTVINQINAMSLVVSNLQSKSLIVDPDDFPGTDSQKLQAAIDTIGDTDSGVIILRRLYTLDDNVIFKTHSLRRTLRVIGVSSNAGFDCGAYHFEGDAAAAGGIFFDNIYFTGSTDKIFAIGANLIRLEFTNCFFYQNNDIFYGEYAQQIRLVNSRFSYCNTIFTTTGAYGCLACSIVSCDVEDCHMVYENVSGATDSSLTITDSCFESFDSVLIKYDVAANETHNIVITGCYFEFVDANYLIDLTNAGANANSVFVISNNYMRESAGRTGTAFVYIDGNSFGNAHLTMNENQCIPAHSAVYLSLPNRTSTFRFLTRSRNVGQLNDPNNTIPIHNYSNIAGRNYINVVASFTEAGDVAILPVQVRDYSTFNVLAVRTAAGSGDLDATKFTITTMDEDRLQITCSDTSLSAGKNLYVVFKASH